MRNFLTVEEDCKDFEKSEYFIFKIAETSTWTKFFYTEDEGTRSLPYVGTLTLSYKVS